jgi:hypothetical protein
MGKQKDMTLKVDAVNRILFMIIISAFFGFLGAKLAR